MTGHGWSQNLSVTISPATLHTKLMQMVATGAETTLATSAESENPGQPDIDNVKAIVFSISLLVFFMGCFYFVVFLDMKRKFRSGELTEDLRGLRDLFRNGARKVYQFFRGGMGISTLWHCLLSCFKKQNKENDSDSDIEKGLGSASNCSAVIERLAAKKTTTSDSSDQASSSGVMGEDIAQPGSAVPASAEKAAESDASSSLTIISSLGPAIIH